MISNFLHISRKNIESVSFDGTKKLITSQEKYEDVKIKINLIYIVTP